MIKIKHILSILMLIFEVFILVTSCSLDNRSINNEILSNFKAPPETVKTSAYWYWISDNISKEGVIKDLHAMKDKGINRAFIGNIGIDDLPYGDVEVLSDKWWEIMHLALKTATDLGIEIGIFNSPGWSQSGGPWIKPEASMRYLATSKQYVRGPQKISNKLEQPNSFFQDVKTLAYPLKSKNLSRISLDNSYITSVPSLSGLAAIVDNNNDTGVLIEHTREAQLTFETKEVFTARSISIKLSERPVSMNASLQAKNLNGNYTTISEFYIDRTNTNNNVGFNPFAPIVISLPTTSSKNFRLLLHNISSPVMLAEVEISSNPRLERFSEKTLAKMHQSPLPYWDVYMWNQQRNLDDETLTINSKEVLDISEYLESDGTLNWDVPEGEWMIMRTGMTSTNVTNAPASPKATGLEVDKMSKKWVAEHFDSFIGQILKRIPEEDRKSFKVVVQDSYETGGQNFTDDFIDDFKDYYGYDPVPYIPVYEGVIMNSESDSERFLWDVRRLVANKVAYDYVGGLRDISHKHGLTTWLENYGHWGFPGEFLMYGGQSDEIGGEFWSEGNLGDIENRAASSCGHIYGKTKIYAESNTSGGPAYSRYPAMMKQRNDRFFAEGINSTLLHVYIMQPYEDKNPGINAWFGNEFDRKNTWFSQLDLYTDYLKRVNYMLQQGINVADVAYFIGEDAPKMTGITDPELPIGYQFDYINAEVIVRDMTVKDGLLTLPHGTQYKILVLPNQDTMRPEVLTKIAQLINDGATVLGPAPTRSPSLQNQPKADLQISEMVKEIWNNVDGVNVKYRNHGKGMILSGMNMEEALSIIESIEDCKLPNDNSIHYGHRTIKDGMDIYFISNQTNQQQIFTPEFRVKNMQPELWNPITGQTRILPGYELSNNSIAVPLKLEPYESTFVVFKDKVKANPISNSIVINYPEPQIITELNTDWTVTFDAEFGGPDSSVLFESLIDWTESSDDRIRYYSGTASYQKKFNVEPISNNEDITIDLGSLTSMAKVYINGQYAGGAWTYPYQVNITPFIKEGENTLEVKVVNNWMNRIIGDMNLPESDRTTWCFVNPYNKNSILQPSGLFGPVRVKRINYD